MRALYSYVVVESTTDEDTETAVNGTDSSETPNKELSYPYLPVITSLWIAIPLIRRGRQ